MKILLSAITFLLLLTSCQEQASNESTLEKHSGNAIVYSCKNLEATVTYNDDKVNLSYTNEEGTDINVDLIQEQTVQGKLWSDGSYSLTLLGESIQINRPFHPVLKCIPKIELKIERPISENPSQNLKDWKELSNYLDDVTYYEDPVKIFQDRNNTIKGLEPIKVWYFQDKPIKMFVPDVGNVGVGKGDYFYYLDGTLAYGRLLNSFMLFNKDGRLIHWMDKNGKDYELSHVDLQEKEAAMREDLDKYLTMAKTFR